MQRGDTNMIKIRNDELMSTTTPDGTVIKIHANELLTVVNGGAHPVDSDKFLSIDELMLR